MWRAVAFMPARTIGVIAKLGAAAETISESPPDSEYFSEHCSADEVALMAAVDLLSLNKQAEV